MSYTFSHKLRQQSVNYSDARTDHVLIRGPDLAFVFEPAALGASATPGIQGGTGWVSPGPQASDPEVLLLSYLASRR